MKCYNLISQSAEETVILKLKDLKLIGPVTTIVHPECTTTDLEFLEKSICTYVASLGEGPILTILII